MGRRVERRVMVGLGTPDPPQGAAAALVVYWRPGCPFCARLRWGLRRRRVVGEWIDIWSDPIAAALVRSHNGGNETVPTVVIGDVVLVNPSARQVKVALERQASDVDQG